MLGIGGRLWSILYVGGKKSAELVRTGPYSITRNPLYLFSCVAAAGAGAQMGSYVSTVGFGIICAICFYVVILREEAFLGRAWGRLCRQISRGSSAFDTKSASLQGSPRGDVSASHPASDADRRPGVFVSIPLFELIKEGGRRPHPGIFPSLLSALVDTRNGVPPPPDGQAEVVALADNQS